MKEDIKLLIHNSNSNKISIDRRNFCKLTALSPLALFIGTYSVESEAFIGALIRLIARPTLTLLGFGGKARAVRASNGARMFLPTAMDAAISTATILWTLSAFENKAEASISNESSSKIRSPFSLGIQDIDTGKIELENNIGIIEAFPNTNNTLPFLFKELPAPGNKRIIGWAEDDRIKIQPSEPILILDNKNFCNSNNC